MSDLVLDQSLIFLGGSSEIPFLRCEKSPGAQARQNKHFA